MARTTIIGTSWFPSIFGAYDYYKPYGFSQEDVRRKARDGEIHLVPWEGQPPPFPGEIRRWEQDHRIHIEVSNG